MRIQTGQNSAGFYILLALVLSANHTRVSPPTSSAVRLYDMTIYKPLTSKNRIPFVDDLCATLLWTSEYRRCFLGGCDSASREREISQLENIVSDAFVPNRRRTAMPFCRSLCPWPTTTASHLLSHPTIRFSGLILPILSWRTRPKQALKKSPSHICRDSDCTYTRDRGQQWRSQERRRNPKAL